MVTVFARVPVAVARRKSEFEECGTDCNLCNGKPNERQVILIFVPHNNRFQINDDRLDLMASKYRWSVWSRTSFCGH